MEDLFCNNKTLYNAIELKMSELNQGKNDSKMTVFGWK